MDYSLKEDIIGDKIKLELNHNLNNINIDYDKISVTNDLIINTLYKLQKYLKKHNYYAKFYYCSWWNANGSEPNRMRNDSTNYFKIYNKYKTLIYTSDMDADIITIILIYLKKRISRYNS